MSAAVTNTTCQPAVEQSVEPAAVRPELPRLTVPGAVVLDGELELRVGEVDPGDEAARRRTPGTARDGRRQAGAAHAAVATGSPVATPRARPRARRPREPACCPGTAAGRATASPHARPAGRCPASTRRSSRTTPSSSCPTRMRSTAVRTPPVRRRPARSDDDVAADGRSAATTIAWARLPPRARRDHDLHRVVSCRRTRRPRRGRPQSARRTPRRAAQPGRPRGRAGGDRPGARHRRRRPRRRRRHATAAQLLGVSSPALAPPTSRGTPDRGAAAGRTGGTAPRQRCPRHAPAAPASSTAMITTGSAGRPAAGRPRGTSGDHGRGPGRRRPPHPAGEGADVGTP